MLELPQTKLLVKKTSTLRIEEGSEESLQTVSTVQSECEDAVEDVLLKMNKFKNERENKKNEKFKIVWLFGITLLVVGLIIYEVLNYMLSVTTHKTSQILYSAFDCFALAISMTGMVICSTVDPSRVDFDSIMEQGDTFSICFRFATCFILLVDALSWYGVCAIPAIVVAFYNLVFLVPYGFLKVKYTSRFIFSMILDEFIAVSSLSYNAYESRTDGNYASRYVWGIGTNTGYPTGSVFFGSWVALTVLCFIEGIGLLFFWLYHRSLKRSNSKAAFSPTTIMYISFYLWLNRYGLLLIFRGSVCLYYRNHSYNGTFNSTAHYVYDVNLIVTGILALIPPVGLFILGPTNVFNFTSRQFDRDMKNLREDGKFIAELLDSVDVQLNDPWWIHYDKLDKPQRLHYDDHRKNWYEAVVTDINETKFSVRLSSNETEQVIVLNRKKGKIAPILDDIEAPVSPTEDMMYIASKNLRCIDWQSMSEDLFTKSVRDMATNSLYSLSRPLKEDELISFFISHAWDDDGSKKYQKLKEVAESFKAKEGKYPTFWFDKVCFDQNNIGDGLKVLPINVMVCRKVLVLYGASYPNRLWCIWELFVLFSFADTKEAVRRLMLCPLDKSFDLSQTLSTFNVNDAKCYDPNEERKLRKVIAASSGEKQDVNEFNLKIQKLAKYIK